MLICFIMYEDRHKFSGIGFDENRFEIYQNRNGWRKKGSEQAMTQIDRMRLVQNR